MVVLYIVDIVFITQVIEESYLVNKYCHFLFRFEFFAFP